MYRRKREKKKCSLCFLISFGCISFVSKYPRVQTVRSTKYLFAYKKRQGGRKARRRGLGVGKSRTPLSFAKKEKKRQEGITFFRKQQTRLFAQLKKKNHKFSSHNNETKITRHPQSPHANAADGRRICRSSYWYTGIGVGIQKIS